MLFISLYCALVWTFYGELKACWEMFLCDNIVCVVVVTVPTCGRPFNTVMLHVLFYFSFPAIFTAAKGALSNRALLLLRIKVVLKVSYLTHPLTTFLMVTATYFDAIDLSLEVCIKSSIAKHVGFATCRAFIVLSCQQLFTTRLTNIVSTIGEEWLSE